MTKNKKKLGIMFGLAVGIAGLYLPMSALAHNPTLSIANNVQVLPNITGTRATGLNNRGMMIGYGYDASGVNHPAFWTRDGSMHLIGSDGIATSVNDRGQIVGTTDLANGRTQGFFWENGFSYTLPPLAPGMSSGANAISPNGYVIGWSQDSSGHRHAVEWSRGQVLDLGVLPGGLTSEATGINSNGDIVGWSSVSSEHQHAVLWAAGGPSISDLGTLDGLDSAATGINRDGRISGWATAGEGETHIVYWEDAVINDVGTLGGAVGTAQGLNLNHLVGSSELANGLKQAYFWEQSMGQIQNLNQILPPNSEWDHIVAAVAINDRQQIAAWGVLKTGVEKVMVITPLLITSTPTPGIAGQTNIITIKGATPGAKVHIIYGTQFGSAQLPGCEGVNADIQSPRDAGFVRADELGNATFSAFIPDSVRGQSILIQGIELSTCRTSLVQAFEFQ